MQLKKAVLSVFLPAWNIFCIFTVGGWATKTVILRSPQMYHCKILKGVDKSVMVFFFMKIVCIILSLFYIIYYFISAGTGLSEVFPKVWLLWMSCNVEGRDLERN